MALIYLDLIEEFQKYHSKVNKSDGDKLIEYLESVEADIGGIYENDVITKIISSNVNKGNRQSVLIIDDLDRVNPEHLFRILNVFAAHFDSRNALSATNKFGFSKVVLVCDVKNLKNIFHYKYGENVDYLGYTDKFYSSHVFQFDNRKSVQSIIKEVLNSIELLPMGSNLAQGESEAIKEVYFSGNWVEQMLIFFLEHDIISLRNLLKIYSRGVRFHYEEVDLSMGEGHRADRAWRTPIVVQIKLLSFFFGDNDYFLKCLFNLSAMNFALRYHEHIAPLFAYVITAERMALRDTDFEVELNGRSLIVAPRVTFSDEKLISVQLFEHGGKDDENKLIRGALYSPSIEEYWKWLYSATNKLAATGYLK